ncbi:hypothetical protein CIB84_010000 [Bambusicola thoracicus]|uniref:Uncharacterized protein n=1 Tax=Bambusicola thoracicus TaxID=9083 RepID=A0A2P4SQ93_BAMTH|nr:hypothetical protein CIB84_010000 [Bambusicola thoracicus]
MLWQGMGLPSGLLPAPGTEREPSTLLPTERRITARRFSIRGFRGPSPSTAAKADAGAELEFVQIIIIIVVITVMVVVIICLLNHYKLSTRSFINRQSQSRRQEDTLQTVKLELVKP